MILNQSHFDTKKSGIYLISSPSSPEKIYVGSTKCFYVRFSNHRCHLRKGIHKNIHLQNQFNKFNDLQFTILAECDESNILELEQLILDEYSSFKEVFNINKSCDRSRLGMKLSAESRLKISINRKGYPAHNKGKKASPELRKKLSIAHTGLPSPMKGIPRTEAHKIAVKKGMSNLTAEQNAERYKKITEGRVKTWAKITHEIVKRRLLNKPQCIYVIQCDLQGNEIKVHHGVKYAAEELGINKNRISGCLKGRYKNGGGYLWKYMPPDR